MPYQQNVVPLKTLTFNKIRLLLMDKGTTLFSNWQEKKDFSLAETIKSKKIRVDFDAPDLSSNGGLLLLRGIDCTLLDKMADLIPEWRKPELIHHTKRDLVRRVSDRFVVGMKMPMTVMLCAMTVP